MAKTSRFLYNVDMEEYKQKFSNEVVTEELDNIPADRNIHMVNPLMARTMIDQAEYDYKAGEYKEGGEDCTSDLLYKDRTEREVIKRNAEREIEYKTRMEELKNEEEETKKINKKIREKTKKALLEEKE